MGIFQQFPYTNFHEMNQDQLIKIMREMQDEWATTKAEWASYKEFIDNYFANLNLDEETEKALRRLLADGSLDAVIDPLIAAEVAEWLNDHITPTTPAIDNTLTVSGAAADAAITGSRSNFHEGIFIPFDAGQYYGITNLVIDITTPTVASGWSSKVVACSEGDIFYLTARAVASPSAYAFIDTNGNVLDRDYNTQILLERLMLVAPANAAYLVVNNSDTLNPSPVLMKYNGNANIMPTVKFTTIPKRYFTPTNNVININAPSHAAGWSGRVIKCEQGDRIIVHGRAVATPALVYFIDNNGAIIQQTQNSDPNAPDLKDVELIAPYNTEYAVINNVDSFVSDPVSYLIRKQRSIIVDINGSGDYTSLTAAIAETSADIIVKAGTYDIVAEYKAKFGANIFNQISDSYTGIGLFRYGLYVNNRTITFETGSHVVCDLVGVLTVDSTHRFSPFNLASDAVLIGLNCYANGAFYVIHDDYGNIAEPYVNKIIDCVLTGNLVNHNIIGGGARIYSTNIVSGCYMNNYEANSETMRYHNYDNPNSQPKVIVENCRCNGSIGARYYGSQSVNRMTFIAHNNSTGDGIVKRSEAGATVDNVNLLTWANVIE